MVDIGHPQIVALDPLRYRRRAGRAWLVDPRRLRLVVELPLEEAGEALVWGRAQVAEALPIEMIGRRSLVTIASVAEKALQADQPEGAA